MKQRYVVYLFIVLLLAIRFAYYIPSNKSVHKQELSIKVDTITYIDTIPYYMPIPKDSIVVRYQIVKLPAQEKDSATGLVDSAEVTVPITQQEYKDSTYHAWVSGYLPRLDSIHVYSKNIKTTNTTTITKYKTKRWAVGVQVGCGYSHNQISPYVGIGVQYNILNW